MNLCQKGLLLFLSLALALGLAACGDDESTPVWGRSGESRAAADMRTLDQMTPGEPDSSYLESLPLAMDPLYLRSRPFEDYAVFFPLARYTLRGSYFCTDDGRYLNADPLPSSFEYVVDLEEGYSIKPDYYKYGEYSGTTARAADLVLYSRDNEDLFRSLDQVSLLKERTFLQSDSFTYLYRGEGGSCLITESTCAGDNINGDAVTVFDLDDNMAMTRFSLRTYKDGNEVILVETEDSREEMGKAVTEYLYSSLSRRGYDRFAFQEKRYETREQAQSFIDQWLREKGITRGIFSFQKEAQESERITPLFIQRLDTDRDLYRYWLRLGPGTTCPALGSLIFGAQ